MTTTTEGSFDTIGISSLLVETLKKLKITIPTPIQHQSIPAALAGKDIMGIAQTGTGKTLAYGLPMVDRLDHVQGRALIILPTRELAVQVSETLGKIGKPFHLKYAVLIGGESMGRQIAELKQNPRIIIATPGRLIDHLRQKLVKLDDIKILVLDEADRMFDMGFAPQVSTILKAIPKDRQTLLFSATMSNEIVKLATTCMALPVRIEVAPPGTPASDIEQEIIIVKQESKLSLLEKLLHEHTGTILVFSRTKFGAKKITHVLRTMGHSAAEIHANRSQSQRREAMAGFKSGKYRILVATDIAARGIDVTNIEIVVNFDLPDNLEDYIHRIGRTGRAGLKGKAISFVAPNQRGDIRAIERLIRKTLTVSKFAADNLPDTPIDENEATSFGQPRRRAQKSGSGGNSSRGGNSARGGDRARAPGGKPFRGKRPERSGSPRGDRDNRGNEAGNRSFRGDRSAPRGNRQERPAPNGNRERPEQRDDIQSRAEVLTSHQKPARRIVRKPFFKKDKSNPFGPVL